MSDISQAEKKVKDNQQLAIPYVERQYQRYFEKVSELQAGDIITSSKCKLCNHPLRAEAEAKWEQTKGRDGRGNCNLVTRFLNEHAEETGVKFYSSNVSQHLNYHYDQQAKRVWLREYGTRLADIMNYKVDRDKMFEGLLQANKLKFFETAANPELDPIKQAEIMTKLSKAILEISTLQEKLRADIDTVDVFQDKFQQIIINFISEQDTPMQKKLMEQLEEARRSLEQ